MCKPTDYQDSPKFDILVSCSEAFLSLTKLARAMRMKEKEKERERERQGHGQGQDSGPQCAHYLEVPLYYM